MVQDGSDSAAQGWPGVDLGPLDCRWRLSGCESSIVGGTVGGNCDIHAESTVLSDLHHLVAQF
jgi:hypothetical protein